MPLRRPCPSVISIRWPEERDPRRDHPIVLTLSMAQKPSADLLVANLAKLTVADGGIAHRHASDSAGANAGNEFGAGRAVRRFMRVTTQPDGTAATLRRPSLHRAWPNRWPVVVPSCRPCPLVWWHLRHHQLAPDVFRTVSSSSIPWRW